MSKKDFELIARTIRDLAEAPEVRYRVAHEFARELWATNPLFDRSRFLRACMIEIQPDPIVVYRDGSLQAFQPDDEALLDIECERAEMRADERMSD